MSDVPAPGIETDEQVLFEGYAAVLPSLGALFLAIVTLGLWLLPAWLCSRSRRYRLTNKRIVVETGLLGKRLEQVDLYRVNDYTVVRPLGQRVLGTGDLILRTIDRTSPVVAIRGIRTDVVALYERIRAATELEKSRRRGIGLMELE